MTLCPSASGTRPQHSTHCNLSPQRLPRSAPRQDTLATPYYKQPLDVRRDIQEEMCDCVGCVLVRVGRTLFTDLDVTLLPSQLDTPFPRPPSAHPTRNSIHRTLTPLVPHPHCVRCLTGLWNTPNVAWSSILSPAKMCLQKTFNFVRIASVGLLLS